HTRFSRDWSSDVCSSDLDAQGRIATWSAEAERIKGYRAEEIIGKPFRTFFTPEDIQGGVPEQLLKKAREEGRARYEGWRVRKDEIGRASCRERGKSGGAG